MIENDNHDPALIQTVRGVGYKFEPPDGGGETQVSA